MVVSHHYGAVRVAEDDLCAHVDEFVHEEESALKHLLMEEHRALGLCGYHDEHREQVGGQSGPGGVGQRHDGAVDEGVHLVVVLPGDDEVVALDVNPHAEPAEGIGDDAQVPDRHVLDADAVAHHGGHADE